MTAVFVYILCALTPGPKDSLKLAAKWTGANYFELHHIAVRESSLHPVGIHPRDAGNSAKVYRNAVAAGWLSPSTCRHHRGHKGGWSSRGIGGLMAALNLKWLRRFGLDCAPPWVLDIPIVSALAMAEKHEARCWVRTRVSADKVVREIDPDGAAGWCNDVRGRRR